MKIVNIGGKEYKFEYTIEASLYNECTEKISNLMMSMQSAQEKEDLKELLASMADIPQTALTIFYAGLIENHGIDGDKTVLSKKDAKRIVKTYFEEHKEDENGDFYSVLAMCMEMMEEDGFFKQIGLQQMTSKPTAKNAKTPQDHKKKSSKVTES